MAATTEHLMSQPPQAQQQEPKTNFDPLAFLNKINGLVMALAVAAWALLGNEYRQKVESLEDGQVEIVQLLAGLKVSVEQIKTEMSIRVQTARDEREAFRTKQIELDARLRDVEKVVGPSPKR